MNFSFIKFKSLKNLLMRIRINALILIVSYLVLDIIIIYQYFYRDNNFNFFSILIVTVSFYFFFLYFIERNNKYCLMKDKLNDDDLENIENDIRNAQLYSSRLAISHNYIYSLKSQFFLPYCIPLKDIVWVYFIYTEKNQSRKPYLYIATEDKTYKLPLNRDVGAVALNLVRIASDEDLLNQISSINSKILIGNTPENKVKYQNKEF